MGVRLFSAHSHPRHARTHIRNSDDAQRLHTLTAQVCLMGTAVSVAAVPFVTSFVSLCVAYASASFWLGGIDTLLNTIVTWLHGPHVGPWMQVRCPTTQYDSHHPHVNAPPPRDA